MKFGTFYFFRNLGEGRFANARVQQWARVVEDAIKAP